MTRKRASNIDVKKINLQNTLFCLLKYDSISQPELARELHLSWPTVLQNVKELIERGLVKEAGSYASTGGRKARAFEAVKDAKVSLGIDITVSHISYVLVNLAGDVINYERKKINYSNDEAYYCMLGKSAVSFLSYSGYPSEKILGAGISVPGIVDKYGRSLNRSHAFDVRELSVETVGKYIPYPCRFINDANAALMAEAWEQDNTKTKAYISLNEFVGGAVATDGTLRTGNNMRAGEFGHQTLYPDGKVCYCGKKGCFDAYCASGVLSRHSGGSVNKFFKELKEGREELKPVLDEYLDNLAIEINNLRMAFDCTIIVGGLVGGYLEDYYDELKERLLERSTFDDDCKYLEICRYKQEASAIGAALLQPIEFVENL